MDIDSDFKREVRIETGMRFIKNLPALPEAREAARSVLEAKLEAETVVQMDASRQGTDAAHRHLP